METVNIKINGRDCQVDKDATVLEACHQAGFKIPTLCWMKDLNELDESAILKFVGTGKFDEVSASLAILNDIPTPLVARVVEGPRADLMLIPCKAAGLNWKVVESILRHRPVKPPIDDRTLWQAQRDFGRLTPETAQRTVRFWQLHNRIEKVGAPAA